MNQDNINKFVQEVLAIEQEEAKEAGALGYMARMLIQATIPHRDPKKPVFERSNGNFSLAMMAHPKVGLPYGSYPRLLLAWMVTEAFLTKNTTLVLGDNLKDFMRELGILSTGQRGGKTGNVTRLRDQMKRLFSSSISCIYEDKEVFSGKGLNIAKEYQLWWDPKVPEQANLWQSTVTLSQEFFDEIVNRPVPIDMRALKALKASPMAIDLYCWLTYRYSYLKGKTNIPWQLLQCQFGADYADTRQGRHAFKEHLKEHLKKVLLIYSDAKIEESDSGLILLPSRTHVRKIATK